MKVYVVLKDLGVSKVFSSRVLALEHAMDIDGEVKDFNVFTRNSEKREVFLR